MSRRPNEVLIARELFEKMLSQGGPRELFAVDPGPSPEAQIIGVCFEHHTVYVEYDRPVDQPELRLWIPNP